MCYTLIWYFASLLGWTGGPQLTLPSPLHPVPPGAPPPGIPTCPPLPSPKNTAPSPIEKDSSPLHITFHFNCWLIFNEITKTVGVCLIVHLLIYLVLQPSQQPSRQHCSQVRPSPRKKAEEKRRQDKYEIKKSTSPLILRLLRAQQDPALL